MLFRSEIGKWMSKNGDTIYGTQSGGYTQGDSIITTKKGNRLFLHILSSSVNSIDIPLDGKVRKIKEFATGEPLKYKFSKGRLTMDIIVPDDAPDYIIEVELK